MIDRMSEPHIEYTTFSRYDPETDTIYIDVRQGAPPCYISEAHEQGHRICVLKGEVPAKLVTRDQEVRAEICAWKHAAAILKKQGLWDDYAKLWAKKSLIGHGIYWDNYMKLEKLVESL